MQEYSYHPWQEDHKKQKRNQSTGGCKLWRKEDTGK